MKKVNFFDLAKAMISEQGGNKIRGTAKSLDEYDKEAVSDLKVASIFLNLLIRDYGTFSDKQKQILCGVLADLLEHLEFRFSKEGINA